MPTSKRVGSPVIDVELQDEADEAPDQEVANNDSDEKLIFRIREASSKIFKETKRPARNDEIAEELDVEEADVKSARDSLQLQRKNRKLSALRKRALQAGFAKRECMRVNEMMALDVERSLISPNDIKRLVRSQPLTYSEGTFEPKEAEMRLELIHESIPLSSAREIIGFVEPLFRASMLEAVQVTLNNKTSRITPTTMAKVLKKFEANAVFTSVSMPPGLVRFAKKDGIDNAVRGDPAQGKLLSASKKDKLRWKKEADKNNELSELFEAVNTEEIARKKKRKMKKAASSEDGATGAILDGEDGENGEPKTKKKKKKKLAELVEPQEEEEDEATNA